MNRHPLVLAVLFALTTPAAFAQDSSAEDKDIKTLDSMIVTGTRASDRTAAESSSPIDIITPEILEATGTTELATALSRALPSLNFPRLAISDGSDAVRPAQLRGLSPDHVLVLVNGKRYHTGALVNVNGTQGRSSSPVDLNTIPISAIKRVEVLRDGASAQYGSDAIAGVINLILKNGDSGGNVGVRYGQASAGDGKSYEVSADAGFKFGEGGIDVGDGGFLHLAAQFGHQDNTDRARPFIGTPTPTSAPLGRVVQRQGDPEVDSYSISYNAEVDAGDPIKVYSYGIHTKRDTLSNGFFRPAGDPRNIPSVYPNGFLPQINNVSTDYAFVGGMKGTTAGGTNIDASYTYGTNKLTFDIKNTLNRSLGPTSPREFFAGALEVDQYTFNVDFSKIIDFSESISPTLSYGIEWRNDSFEQSPGEPLSYANGGVIAPGATAPLPGAQVFTGFRPSDSGEFDRHNLSLYIGLEGNLTEKFSAGIAARYEDYSDFGDTTTGKLTGRYNFSDAVALRGTISTGFHAPSLQQQFFQSTATNFIGGIPFDIVTFRVTNPAAIALGAEPLRPEKSTNFSLGLVLQPIDKLYVTVDAYRVELEDRISLSENLTSTAVRNFLNANGFIGVGGGRYFTNAIDTTTDGVDIVGTYGWELGGGNLDMTLGYNYNKTKIDRIASNPATLTAIDPTALRFGRVEIGRFEVGSPRDKFLVGGVWKNDSWEFSANATRYGEITILNANPLLDQTFGAKWTLDLSASYKANGWRFTVGGDNVLDTYPDEVLFANSLGGQLPYATSAAPFGLNGAFAYVKAGYEWK
jgi:iron complex outermembrane recepter protein